jgi:hypothetical protein
MMIDLMIKGENVGIDLGLVKRGIVLEGVNCI